MLARWDLDAMTSTMITCLQESQSFSGRISSCSDIRVLKVTSEDGGILNIHTYITCF